MNYDQWKTASSYDGDGERDNSEVTKAFSFTYPSPYALYRGIYYEWEDYRIYSGMDIEEKWGDFLAERGSHANNH